jgi:hypothetical protein
MSNFIKALERVYNISGTECFYKKRSEDTFRSYIARLMGKADGVTTHIDWSGTWARMSSDKHYRGKPHFSLLYSLHMDVFNSSKHSTFLSRFEAFEENKRQLLERYSNLYEHKYLVEGLENLKEMYMYVLDIPAQKPDLSKFL